MKKIKSLPLTLFVPIILIFVCTTLFANTLVVDRNPLLGFISCENTFFPYATIQSAVNNANNGDTIKICKGNYNETVTIDGKDNLTITNGSDAPSPSDINWYSNGDTLSIKGDTKNLIVENMSIKSTSSSANNKNIYIMSAKDKITFQNLIINTQNGANAIWGEYGVDANLKGVFKNLSVKSGASGISIQKGDKQDFEDINMTLSGNSANNYGIYLNTSVADKNHIFKNLIFHVNAQPAIKLSSGKKMSFKDINITATGYSDNTKAISLDYSTTADDLTFQNLNINVNRGSGVYIAQAKDITAKNITINGTTNNAFYADSGVSGNFSFDTLNMNINNDGGVFLKNGKNVTIKNANINGSGGNGWGLKTDWGVTGNFTFSDVNVSAHAGGIDVSKGLNVSFAYVRVVSDSSSANDKAIMFNWGNFKKMIFTNCDLNATGNALQIAGSSDLTVDASKLTTRGDSAINIGTNVTKMHLKNSCFHNTSTSGNSYAIYINNWKNDIHINNNCIYAPNSGNYARDSKVHDWDGNYWDGVKDVNGDGKISNADTNKISANIVDNNPNFQGCTNGCSKSNKVLPVPVVDYRMDECSWDNNIYDIKNYGSLGSNYNATAGNDANVTKGKLCNGGDIVSTTSKDKYIFPKNGISLPQKYTITTWIKFPLSGAGHQLFSSNEFFNIADRPGSNNDFIYFAKWHQNWDLCVYGNEYECHAYNPNNLQGWHFLTFKIDGSKTEFYVDGEKKLTFTQSPSNITLGLIFNSDYGTYEDNQANGQSIGAVTDEFKIFDEALNSSQIQDIYNNEKDGKDYNGTARICPACGNILPVIKNYKFDAWDIFRNINDRNISTKIVKRDFDLNISSLDANKTQSQEFNGTVCVKIIDKNDTNLTNWKKIFFNEKNSSDQTTDGNPDFNVSSASKDNYVNIKWKKDVNTACPLPSDANETNSTDNFAIRPDRFTINNISSPIYAGEDFNISFQALDDSNHSASGYNETKKDLSFVIESNSTKAGCINGTLHVDDVNFSDGKASDVNATYTNLGDVNITIKDSNDSNSFAYVDHNDTNDSQRLISPATATIYVKPYELNVTDVNFTTSTSEDWLYMAHDIHDMNVTLGVTVKAFNKQGTNLQDFNSTCYAKDVNVTFYYDINNTNSDINLTLEGNLTSNDTNISDINKTLQIPKKLFKNGEANSSYAFGIDRNSSKMKNPLKTILKDANVTTTDVSKNVSDKVLNSDNNATFYYGRVLSKNITTNQKTVTNNLTLEVYDSNSSDIFVNGFAQDSLKWFQMKKDAFTHILNFIPKSGFLYSDSDVSGIDDINTTQSTSKGMVDFNITNHWTNSQNAYIHIDIPSYLWYSHYNEYNATKDCSTHPCFQYIYTINDKKNNIQSGDFNGTSIGKDYNATRYQRGVKVFR